MVITSGLITYLFATNEDTNLELSQCIIITSISLIAGAMPVSFAGFGLRELSFVGLMEMMSVQVDVAFLIAVSFSLSLFVASLAGGLVWMGLALFDLFSKNQIATKL